MEKSPIFCTGPLPADSSATRITKNNAFRPSLMAFFKSPQVKNYREEEKGGGVPSEALGRKKSPGGKKRNGDY